MNAPSFLSIGIEASTKTPGVALHHNGQYWEKTVGEDSSHARGLVPALEQLAKEAKVEIQKIGLVVASTGPGSYTGLRVGIAAALTLCQAARVPIVGICSLDAIAANAPDGTIAVIVNAYGGELYYAVYLKRGEQIKTVATVELLPPDKIVEKIPSDAALMGDGIPLLTLLPASAQSRALPKTTWAPKPSVLLRLGIARFQAQGADDPKTVRPLYLRPSRAEILHQQRQASKKN